MSDLRLVPTITGILFHRASRHTAQEKEEKAGRAPRREWCWHTGGCWHACVRLGRPVVDAEARGNMPSAMIARNNSHRVTGCIRVALLRALKRPFCSLSLQPIIFHLMLGWVDLLSSTIESHSSVQQDWVR